MDNIVQFLVGLALAEPASITVTVYIQVNTGT